MHECAGADAALKLLDEHPDTALLFSDVDLGDGPDGLELAREAVDRHPALKVLMTSGNAPAPSTPERARLLAHLLKKPYRRDELADRVRQTLDATG